MVTGPLPVEPGKSARFDLAQAAAAGIGSVAGPDSTFRSSATCRWWPISTADQRDGAQRLVVLLPTTRSRRTTSSRLQAEHRQQPGVLNVIGLKDGTVVVDPAGGDARWWWVNAVNAGQTGMATIGDYDLLQISAGQSDISGTTSPVRAGLGGRRGAVLNTRPA